MIHHTLSISSAKPITVFPNFLSPNPKQKMTKTYAVLQKKLEELELQVQLISHNNNIHPSLSQEIHQKLLFIANLLSAEIASSPSKPRHLKHIADRLAQLESAFRDWGIENLLDHVDDSSACSCTESCLNDDGEVASSCVDDEDENREFYECVEDEKEEKEEMVMIMKEEKRSIVGIGKLCGAMASGCIIGMALMGVAISYIEFFGYLQVQQRGGFVTPT